MTGLQVTEQQLKQASDFLDATGNKVPERFAFTRAQLVNIMAWYAEIRGQGDGSGRFVVNGGKGHANRKTKAASLGVQADRSAKVAG